MVLRLISVDGRTVADDVRVAKGFRQRARGLIGEPEPRGRRALLLPGAKQIHTFGMQYAIDVVFCSGEGEVVRVIRHLRPRRLTRPTLRSRGVFEMRSGAAEGVSTGDRLILAQSSVPESPR